MTQKNAGNIKYLLSALTLCLVAQQSITSQASASMITGVKPEDVGGHNQYNITPEGLMGDKDIGFKTYGHFTLDEGDIANLIFNYYGKDVSKFVNLVDNQIDINGIVNAVNANGQFNNGQVFFVSPKGMVVGASGVLNVGSLTVLTPDQNKFDKFKSDADIRTDLTDLYSEGTGNVTINGKVIARGDVDIRAASVNVNNSIMAGVGNNNEVFTSNTAANNLFNQLVNTDNLKAGNAFSSENGNIKITAYSGDGGVKLAEGSTLKNFGKGDVDILSKGTEGIVVNGDIKNPDGNINLTTTTGSIEAGGNVVNRNGNITADSANGIYLAQNAELNNKNGNITLINKGTKGVDIKGSIENRDGDLTINNTAKGGITIDGAPVNNFNGNTTMTNTGEDGTTINGTITNTKGNSTYTNTSGALIVNGVVNNEGGNMKFDNTGTGIQVNYDADITNTNGNLEMYNTGADGILIDENSTVTNNTGDMFVLNTGEGGMTINGTLTNTKGNAAITNEAGKLNVNGVIKNNDKLLAITNTGTGLNINDGALVDSEGQLIIDNSGVDGMNISGTVQSLGDADITNSNGDLNIHNSALISHKSVNNNHINITNTNTGNKLYIDGKVVSENGNMNISNTGSGGLHIDKNGEITNNVVDEDDNIPVFEKHSPQINISNDSLASMDIDGTVNANGSSYKITNAGKGALNIKETGVINGNITKESYIQNTGDGGIKIAGNVNTNNGSTEGRYLDAGLTIENDNAISGIHITETGNINSENSNHTFISNNGEKGIVVDGKINQDFVSKNANSLKITNTGRDGINITSTGRINNTSSTYIKNSGKEGIKVAGLIDTNGLNVENTGSNVVIGDETRNDNYITSSDDVNINIENGSLLNSGVDKTLIKTTNNGNLNIDVVDGSVGLDDGNKGVYIGVGPKSRDFTKSINVNVDGAITATTEQNQSKEDLNVNIAGKNSDLKIDHIKADGKVILTTADFDESKKGYSILNASTDPTKANIEGKGIALIASDKIGDTDNKLTFNQTEGQFNKAGYNLDKLEYTPNAEYGMDVLAINDINIKGQDDKYDTNVGTMISREGSINAEFSGNTYVREVTADKELNMVTRGAEFVIDNLGTVPYTPEDYFGPNGDIAPDTLTVKALDINPNTRVDDAGLVDGIHSHWADSHIIIKNGRVDDNAKIVFTGDNVYAGGYRFYMGKERNEDGKTYWVYDDRTAMTDMSGNDPTIRVNAVREDDVTSIGRKEEERNYYTGGSVQEDKPWYGDDDDDDDDDHLIVPEPGDDDDDDEPDPPPPGDDDDDEPDPPPPGDDDDDEPDPPPPGDDDDDEPDPPPPGDDDDEPDPPPPGDDDDEPDPPPPGDDDDDDHGATMDDAKRTWKKIIADDISIVDKRQYMRFYVDGNIPVQLESTDKISSILDISRGGIAVSHNNNLKVGEIVPVHITYGDIDINANVKIVTASDVRAGAEFVNLDSATANKILYVNLLLEEQQMLSASGEEKQI